MHLMVRLLLIAAKGFQLELTQGMALARPASTAGPSERPRIQPRWRGIAPVAGASAPAGPVAISSAQALAMAQQHIADEIGRIGAQGLQQRADAIRQATEAA